MPVETVPDEFGRDPNVRQMRRVFALMEERQGDLLAAAGISPLDERLRYCRERARIVFEKAWAGAARKGQDLAEEDLAALYVRSLARLLVGQGFSVPEQALPESQVAVHLLWEALP